MTSSGGNSEGIDVELLEKRLEGLRDTQESVQGLSIWCQANKKFATAIIETWLTCLRKSPVEKRLTLFYLANDVVQHAKRKGDLTLINQWAVAVQKATPHVRTPSSISSAIARIFKIWEERNIYSRDAVADLLSLLNSTTAKEKLGKLTSKKKPETYTASSEKVQAFQPSALISKIKLAYHSKSHIGVAFRTKQYYNMNMEQLIGSIKDRQHGMEVIQEMAQLLDECRSSEHKLLSEVEDRRKIVEVAEVGIVSYENIRSEATIVNAAYKNFTLRVESTKEKLDEKIKAFQEMESPEPSFPGPDVSNSGSGSRTSHNNYHTDKISSATANNTYISRDVLQSTNFDTLKSLSLPPSQISAESASAPPPQPQYTDYSISRTNEMSSESFQQPSYTPVQSTGYDPSMIPWTNETYNSMMTSMMNIQYQQAPQPQIPQPPPTAPPPVFSLTPSMQLQMQMQQQHVASLQQQQYHSPQQYSSTNSYQVQPVKGPTHGAADIGSIPLPPTSDNPPLPPEPNQRVLNASGTESYSEYPPLPSDFNFNVPPPKDPNQHQFDTSYESTSRKSAVSSYTPEPRFHPYNNYSSHDQSETYAESRRNFGNKNIPQVMSGMTSSPRPFGSARAQFNGPRNSFSTGNNGYQTNERFKSPNAHNSLSPVDESPLNSKIVGNPEESLLHAPKNLYQSFDNLEDIAEDAEFAETSLNEDESIGPSSYNSNLSFYERSFTNTNSSPRMLSPQKGPRMPFSNFRGRGGFQNAYDRGGGFRPRGIRGMRGGFDRGGRRGGYR